MGRGEAWTPVICKPRLDGAEADARCRFRNALKEEARGAAMVVKSFRVYTDRRRWKGKRQYRGVNEWRERCCGRCSLGEGS